MLYFILKRVGMMVLTMLVTSIVLFLVLEINIESLAVKVLGQFSTDEQRLLWLENNGYFRPVYIRYFEWLARILQGDFGRSVVFQEEVSVLLWPRLARTALLAGLVLAIAIPISIIFGILAGMKEGSLQDRSVSVFCIITTSVPEFCSATLISWVFVFSLKWLPGTSSMISGFSWKEMILPVLVLVIYDFGYIARMTRASMAEVMQTQYIRTAHLKGLPFHKVVLQHGLRNSLIAPFTVIMLQIPWLLSGVIVTEYFFAYKGIGTLLLDASLRHDVFLIEAITLVAVFVAVTTQALSDIGYMYLNPKIRFS